MKIINNISDLKKLGDHFVGWTMIDPKNNWNYCIIPVNDLISIPISSLPKNLISNCGDAPIVVIKIPD